MSNSIIDSLDKPLYIQTGGYLNEEQFANRSLSSIVSALNETTERKRNNNNNNNDNINFDTLGFSSDDDDMQDPETILRTSQDSIKREMAYEKIISNMKKERIELEQKQAILHQQEKQMEIQKKELERYNLAKHNYVITEKAGIGPLSESNTELQKSIFGIQETIQSFDEYLGNAFIQVQSFRRMKNPNNINELLFHPQLDKDGNFINSNDMSSPLLHITDWALTKYHVNLLLMESNKYLNNIVVTLATLVGELSKSNTINNSTHNSFLQNQLKNYTESNSKSKLNEYSSTQHYFNEIPSNSTSSFSSPSFINSSIKSCKCEGDKPCSKKQCSCYRNNKKCNSKCKCQKGGNICCSHLIV